jgi:simple sugar transport system ATP-binding protein/ribose transport system ATP-binding protein
MGTPNRRGTPVVELTGISKRFGSTRALADATVTLYQGEVHALVGENGAGKSTLGKVIGGLYRPDSGSVTIFGERVHRWDPKKAQDNGVVMIAQELSLVPARSVADNVFLGIESSRLGVLRPGTAARYAEIEERCRFGLDPDAPVSSLRLADQQKVEIMRALARDARVIIMDEPTSSLTADEAERLHAVMRWLKSEGTAVIYVTHFLDAVLEHCDRTTVMRDGRVVRTSETSRETKASLIEGMLGRSLDVVFPERSPGPGPEVPPALELRSVTRGLVREVSLAVRPGEIVGLAGLVGSGRTEIARLVFGADQPESGTVEVDGKPITSHGPRHAISRGVALIPEDRRAEGLVLLRNVRENITLPHLSSTFTRAGVVSRRAERKRVNELIAQLQVTPHQVDGNIAVFSGGNQQKVLFAKWLLGDPRVLVLDEPTRGVDIGAKQTIYSLIAEIAAAGTAVLLISSEHEEVLGLAHRVLLIRDGGIIGEMDPATTSVDDVLHILFGEAEPRTDTTFAPSTDGAEPGSETGRHP